MEASAFSVKVSLGLSDFAYMFDNQITFLSLSFTVKRFPSISLAAGTKNLGTDIMARVFSPNSILDIHSKFPVTTGADLRSNLPAEM
jgi:hypothetical protein